MASNRFSVAPTVTVLAGMKARLAGATKGHALLKKKADALSVKFRQILKLIVQTKEAMGRTMKDAAFALTEAKYAAGDFRYHLFALGLPKSALFKLRTISKQQACVNMLLSCYVSY